MSGLREALDALPHSLPEPAHNFYMSRSKYETFSHKQVREIQSAARHEGARLALERAIALLASINNHANPMTANDAADALRAQLKELDQ